MFRGRSMALALTAGFILAGPVTAVQAGDPGRVLLANSAVQQDLGLSETQIAALQKLNAEMEGEIAGLVKTERSKLHYGEKLDDDREDELASPVIERFAPKMMALLNAQQAVRLWEIGAQTDEVGALNSNRTRRVIALTDEQIKTIARLHADYAQKVQTLVVDVDRSLPELRRDVAQLRQQHDTAVMNMLTQPQRADFHKLLGRPFRMELLKDPDWDKSNHELSFIFAIGPRFSVLAIADPAILADLKTTKDQGAKLDQILKRVNDGFTQVRLGALKPLKQPFSKLPAAEQVKIVQQILQKSEAIADQGYADAARVLNDAQVRRMKQWVIRRSGGRVLEIAAVADALSLTKDQRAAYAKLAAACDQMLSPLRVYGQFDTVRPAAFSQAVEAFDRDALSLLTEKQREKLEELGRLAPQPP